MSYFWAQFKGINGATFRFDTRVYLQPIDRPSDKDICIGAVIGKNPGSAQPADPGCSKLQQIQLGNDRLLPNVRNIMIKAYNAAGKEIIPNSYIQILNLFYLCDPALALAQRRIREYLHNHPNPTDCAENNEFPFVFYSWGGPTAGLNDFKDRFIKNIRTNNHVWFDYNEKRTKTTKPLATDCVKHVQGLSHNSVVPHIAAILKKQS